MKRLLLALMLISCQSQLHKIDTLGADYSENSLPLSIIALNIGQGDATLIETPNGHNYLIDAGPPGSGTNIILPYLESAGVTLDALFVTHYDSDHIGGIPEIYSESTIIYDRGDSPLGLDSTLMNAGDELELDDSVTLSCLIINGELADGTSYELDPDDENGRSMGLLIEYGDFRYWTSGDLTGGGLDGSNMESVVAPLIGDIDILHVNHHGSLTSTNEDFLDAVTPEAAIISAGTDNSYGHPAPEIISRLLERNIDVYLTSPSSVLDPDIIHQAEEGVWITVENGDSWTIHTQ